MEHMNGILKCFTLAEGMWFIVATTVAVCSCSVAYIHPASSKGPEAFNSSTPSHVLSKDESVKGALVDLTNITHSYIEGSLISENSTASPELELSINPNQNIESTSPYFNSLCSPCTALEEYNLTDNNGTVWNSSSFLLSSFTRSESVGFFNIGVIIGIAVLVVFILLLIGMLAVFAYRHFSWNRPQTLTDKFSNDESTGYIDDTAFRENSEELYSLDNDSFLNSLEAMTIQNYWTDHVKHTKL